VPHVLQAQRLFGDPDYLLQVVSRDLPDFQRVYDDRLATPARSPTSQLHPHDEDGAALLDRARA
jgi:hypothetical protein